MKTRRPNKELTVRRGKVEIQNQDSHFSTAQISLRRKEKGRLHKTLDAPVLSSVDASMQSIRRRPEIYSLVHGSYPRSLIRRFPYAVFYEYAETTVTSTACFTRHATHRSGAS